MEGTIFFMFCLLSLVFGYDQELLEKGELRKACSRRGNAIQPARRVNSTSRLIKLRHLMGSEVGLRTIPIEAYIVTSGDEHQSVEVDEYERRREYISGFSGSYGDAIITMNKAALWTDGRYHLQADEQIDCNWLLMREGHRNIPTRSQWLKSQFPWGARVGVNPKLISEYMWNKFKQELADSKIELVALNVSLIDNIWPPKERGQMRSKDAFVLNFNYTGKNYSTKLDEVRKQIVKAGAEAMVVTSLDEIAWLLNIRGRDVPFSPFVRSYLIIDKSNIFMYVNSNQLVKNDVLRYLHAESTFRHSDTVQIRNYSDIWPDLRTKCQLYTKILVPSHCVYSEGASHAIYEHIFPNRRLPRQSPIIYLKAVKNQVEIKGMRRAHIKDAAALCDFFSYIEKQMRTGRVFSEAEMADILDDFRYEQNQSLGNSFRTIVGFGPNSAQPHYIPTNNTNSSIFDNGTLVIESGAQYYEGTTDVTRTLHFGTPDDLMVEAYTRVLIGHMTFASLTFPDNMRMAHTDALARGPLWEMGLDYLHETGHGIGAFLGVRESPIAVQYDLEFASKQTFKPGYFLTNEPGYYKEGYFGVRLQNVLEVVEKPWLQHTSGHKYLGFKVISLVPYKLKLIKLGLLSTHQLHDLFPTACILKILEPQYPYRKVFEKPGQMFSELEAAFRDIVANTLNSFGILERFPRRWLNRYNEEIRQEVGAELKRQNKMEGFYWMMENTKYIPENGITRTTISNTLLLCSFFVKLVVFT